MDLDARTPCWAFATPNPQRVVHLPASSSYYERIAFHPCRLGATDRDRFAPIEQVHQQLTRPLLPSVTTFDIDARVPEEWTPPILVSEFEEMDD